MSSIEDSTNQPAPQQPTSSTAAQVTQPIADDQKSQQGSVDFMLVVWAAFFHSVQVGQETAQTFADQLYQTQGVEADTNNVLATYQYQTIGSQYMHGSWNPQFAAVQEFNDRIQAQINVTQNESSIEQQTGQVQSTNANTTIQNTAQAMQQGDAIAKEIGSLTQQIGTI